MADDELIYEMDVFISSKLNDYLHVFQFPVRSESFSGDSCPTDARIKPESQVVELNIPIDTTLPTYNVNKGSELGVGLDDTPLKTSDNPGFSNSLKTKLFDCQSITSHILPGNTHYYVGAIKDGEVHISKVKAVAQFRPSFSAIDKINEKTLISNKKPEKPTTSAAKAVQVQVRKTNLNALETQRKNIIDLTNERKEEGWQKLNYFSLESEKWDSAYKHLFCENKELVMLPKESKSEYIKLMSSSR